MCKGEMISSMISFSSKALTLVSPMEAMLCSNGSSKLTNPRLTQRGICGKRGSMRIKKAYSGDMVTRT